MLDIDTTIEEISGCDPTDLSAEVLASTRPLVLRGLVADWPIVQRARRSPQAAMADIAGYYNGKPVSLFLGTAEINGRFFYNEDLSGFNFLQMEANLADVIRKLIESEREQAPPAFYVGATAVDSWLPGFRRDNDINLGRFNPLVSVWIGNRSRVSAHFDVPDNLACCVIGKRRFTVFPPEQLANLYVGPMDLTPAGQQISLVDFHDPDLSRFPRFSQALAQAQTAELEAGDALFVPGMWWHHVEALEPLNALVNYWWSSAPDYLGSPADALNHALFAIAALSPQQRSAWQAQFDHYVFDPPEDSLAHIPESARGRLGGVDQTAARRLRAELLNRLKQ